MPFKWIVVLFIIIPFYFSGCLTKAENTLRLGSEKVEVWLPMLEGKKVGLLINHTSLIGTEHLLDSMLSLGIDVKYIFVPEHGFRGTQDAGQNIEDGYDNISGLPIISLYGASKKPHKEQMQDLDVVVFDIQDVGIRFYTYISSMHYMMEACAEYSVPMLILDRPNPNGNYVDGPVLKDGFSSFVGMHPIPIVHGLTVGELANMINHRGWLKDGVKCDLTVITMDNYNHNMEYVLPVKPSPNLPNYLSVRLYPSLCFFEGTEISVGRGTQFPFQVIGYPNCGFGDFSFIPKAGLGATQPLQENKVCYGLDLRNQNASELKFTLGYLLKFYKLWGSTDDFFSKESFFNLLAGNDSLIVKIKEGWSEDEIRESWQDDLNNYLRIREQYLLYP